MEIEIQLSLKHAIEDLNLSTNQSLAPNSKSTRQLNRIKSTVNCEYKRKLELLEIEFEQLEHENQQFKFKINSLTSTNDNFVE